MSNFSCFCCCLLTFSKLNFQKKKFRNTIGVSNGLDSEQYQCSVGPDLGPSCFKGYQQMTKVAAGKERVKYNYCIDAINKHLLNDTGASQAQWSKCI